jgi:hypothetical protein
MANSIWGVLQTAVALADEFEASSRNFILSPPFNDPTWGPLTKTTDINVFKEEINKAICACGGGDDPELFYHGLLDAIQACDSNSIVFTFTDASPKDPGLRPQALSLALDKCIKINTIYVEFYSSFRRSLNSPNKAIIHASSQAADD